MKEAVKEKGPLPYGDAKSVGAADFYFAIQATFAFVYARLGADGLRHYWAAHGREYMRPVWERWRDGGLPAVAAYWRAFFAAEPGAEVEVREEPGRVVLEVKRCPAINHLKAHRREILPVFCQHCYFVSDAAAEGAGLAARVCGGDGACVQTFLPRADAPPQDLARIATVSAAVTSLGASTRP